MKKFRTTSLFALLMVGAGALTSCGKRAHGDILFWSSFGTAYTAVLDSICASVANDLSAQSGKTTTIEHVSKGSYPKVLEEVTNSYATLDYPNIVTGYPDHFAEYLSSDILVSLDRYVKTYNKDHGGDILEDYYDDYMFENWDLDVDSKGNEVLSALPFNKSTELMGYNGTFVEYCVDWCAKNSHTDWHLDVVPKTWQEWEVKGPQYRQIMSTLCKSGENPGYAVFGEQDGEGKASNFTVEYKDKSRVDGEGKPISSDGKKLLLDFTDIDVNQTRVISWDSLDNMFITLIKQWGAEYTRLTKEEKLKNSMKYRKGDVMFLSKTNKPKAIECLKFFNKLYKANVFGYPQDFGTNFSSDAFLQNKVMFMLCSSGGLSYNTPNWENRFRLAPLPYFDGYDNITKKNEVRKYVISQGADIALTDAGENYEECFEAMVKLTTGDYQAEWCLQTGYYPCSKSATNSAAYQTFLHEADPENIQKYATEKGISVEEAKDHFYKDNKTRVAYREGSNVNDENYMDKTLNWNKFVDPAFKGSSLIRTKVQSVFAKVFQNVALDASDEVYGKVLEDIKDDDDIETVKTIRFILD